MKKTIKLSKTATRYSVKTVTTFVFTSDEMSVIKSPVSSNKSICLYDDLTDTNSSSRYKSIQDLMASHIIGSVTVYDDETWYITPLGKEIYSAMLE